MPTYAIVRPRDGKRVGWHQLQSGPNGWLDEIKGFLERGIAESRVTSR